MSYLVLNGKKLKSLLNAAKIKLKGVDFDTIAVRGNSGLLLGAPMAVALEKDLVVIRKDESNHSSSEVEGWKFGQRVLILDDFVDSGATLKLIEEKVLSFCPNVTIVGTYLYAEWKQTYIPYK